MAGSAQGTGLLVERLRARRGEIEEAILTRVYAIDGPSEVRDSEYRSGLRAAVGSALGYAFTVLESEEPSPIALPAELLTQARFAARTGVSLDTVLRRYFAGYTLLCEYLLQEVQVGSPLQGALLGRSLRAEASLFDQIVVAVAEAHSQEVERQRHGADSRRIELVSKLLSGHLIDVSGLGYDLNVWHLGVVAIGPDARAAIRCLAATLDRHLLLVRSEAETVWAWFGGRQSLPASEVSTLAKECQCAGTRIAFGEPGHGVEGWRLTHRQAKAAIPVAPRDGSEPVCYGDVALLTAALRDDLLADSLQQAYLAPLEGGRDGGKALRQTLRAYLSAGRNVSSAAAALGVSRQTVKRRVCTAEERIGQPVGARAAEIETALRLPSLDAETRANLQPS